MYLTNQGTLRVKGKATGKHAMTKGINYDIWSPGKIYKSYIKVFLKFSFNDDCLKHLIPMPKSTLSIHILSAFRTEILFFIYADQKFKFKGTRLEAVSLFKKLF